MIHLGGIAVSEGMRIELTLISLSCKCYVIITLIVGLSRFECHAVVMGALHITRLLRVE